MKSYNPEWGTIEYRRNRKQEPDFDNILSVLERKVPKRPTLFEFFLNEELYLHLTGRKCGEGHIEYARYMIDSFKTAGYDYATIHASKFAFKIAQHMEEGKKSVSQNLDGLITDKVSFDAYPWPNADNHDYSLLKTLSSDIPKGMKLIVYGPGGVLENVIQIIGYETLCYLMADDMPLVQEVFAEVGARLVRYYELSSKYDTVGAMISNDDWGFGSQTMLSTALMKKLVIPWHKEIVKTIHAAGKPAILHSCGQLSEVMDDVIDTIGFDAKHSYEDKIIPVEEAYEKWHDRIAILGGLDLDFVCRGTPEEIWKRGVAMLERSSERGGYALGSGNSIPYYVPEENYLAMTAAIEAFL